MLSIVAVPAVFYRSVRGYSADFVQFRGAFVAGTREVCFFDSAFQLRKRLGWGELGVIVGYCRRGSSEDAIFDER